jgi:hypothetical protein
MSLSSSINDWNIIDSESKSSKLDIIIEYLKKNNIENAYLRKLDTLTKKVNASEKNQQLILEKLDNIEKHLNINPENIEKHLNINPENIESIANIANIANIEKSQEFPETIDTQNIYRLSNNIWRNNTASVNELGLKYLTTPNLSLKQLKYPLNCDKCKKCEKMKK